MVPSALVEPGPGVTSAPTRSRGRRGEWIALAAILLASLALRLALLPHRWINPDEGAHLMDGRLLLDGLIPLVDFDSRQVLYVYILAGWLKLTGFHLATARLLPLGASLAVGLLVFAIARRLFGARPAVIATAVYAFFPLSVLWSANVHMQPITLVLTCIGFTFLTGLLDQRPVRAAALAGVAFGLTFYVRESALAAIAAAVTFILFTSPDWSQRTRRIGALAAGFLCVSGIVIAAYSTVLSPAQLWSGPLNPLSLPLRVLTGHEVWVGPEESVRVAEPAPVPRFEQQSLRRAASNIRLMATLALFLLVGLAASLPRMRPAAWRSDETRREAAGFLLLWLWFGFIALAYGYWTFKLGFYPQYFTEMVPPLAIAFGAVVPSAAERWAGRELPPLFWIGIGLLLAGVFAGARAVELSTLTYLVTPALLLAGGAAFAGRKRTEVAVALGVVALLAILGVAPRFPGATVAKAAAALAAFAIALGLVRRIGRGYTYDFFVVALSSGAAILSMQRAGRVLDVSYQCVWPFDLLAPVANAIRAHSAPGDAVMSGAVSWEFEADRRPFLRVSHPLKFLARRRPDEQAEVEHGIIATPPGIVVLDGYTERTYGKVLPNLGELIQREYTLIERWEGGRYPVQLFRRSGAAEP